MNNNYRYPTEPKYPLFIPEARAFAIRMENTNSSDPPFSPEEIGRAYGYTLSDSDGEGITVAVVGAFGSDTVENDFQEFGRYFSLPQNKLEVYYPNGKSRVIPRSWELEANTDTQWVYATSPSARIICVFASDSQIESLFSAVDFAISLGADIISMSWGSSEFAGQQRYTDQMKSSGKIYVASAGDTGGSVLFPSSSDAVISVGGTVLHRNEGGVFARTAWRNGGGGPSLFTPIPEWQRIFDGINEMSGGMRATPDVALDASQIPGYAVYYSKDGGIISVSGTSVAGSLFAGICAKILQKSREKVTSSGGMAPYLYTLAGKTEYSDPQYNFFDITIGNNGRFNAMKGYDMCTGLGAPNNLG